MATVTSTKFPTGNGTSVAGSGTWVTDATGLNADDGTKANWTTLTKNDVGTLTVGTFGFDSVIPASATIVGVDIVTQNDGTTGGTQRHVIRIGATDGGNNDNSTGAESVRTFSNLARPGGGVWTRADLLDGTLTVRVEARQPNNTTLRTYSWDYVTVVVRYVVTPSALPTTNLQAWLMADDLGLADNTAVATWADSFSSSHNFTQATGANQPTCQTDEINGFPCVRFDGSNDVLVGAAQSNFLAAGAKTVFVVYKVTTHDASGRYILGADTTDNWGILNSTAGPGNLEVFNYDGSTGPIVTPTGFATSTWGLFCHRHDTGVIYAKIGKSGTEASDVNGNTFSMTGLMQIGAGTAGGSHATFGGDIAEILIYNAALSAANRTLVEDYLTLKYFPDACVTMPPPRNPK